MQHDTDPIMTVTRCAALSTSQMQGNVLHQLNAPVLFVNGELDKYCRPQTLQEACSGGRLPSHSSARIVTLPV